MLARQLEISRGPLREALHQLIQEGLLEQRRHRGVFVVRLDESDVADIYFVRETIEIPAAIHLARNPSAEAIAALHEFVELMTGAANRHDWALVVQLDAEFHQVIYVRSVGSERLARMFDTLQAETRMCVGALRPAYPVEYEVVVEHQELLRALLGGDEEAIRSLWLRHLRDAAANLGRTLTARRPARRPDSLGQPAPSDRSGGFQPGPGTLARSSFVYSSAGWSSTSAVTPRSTMRPRYMTRIRSVS